jgi:hypothetical protein
MKEIASVATNHIAQITDGDLVPHAEVIFSVSEVEYRLNAEGNVVKSRELQSFRFVATPKTLRNMAALFTSSASVLEGALDLAVSKYKPLAKKP